METVVLTIIIPLVAGYILDLLFGDPYRMPHPVKFFGHAIATFEKRLNQSNFRVLKGALTSLVLVAGVYAFFYFSESLLNDVNIWLTMTFNTIFVYYGLANRCLIDEGRAVFKALDESLDDGRLRLSYIVGRETKNLSPNQVRTAVFETMSENLSDGVVAPLFYYCIGGVPAMMAYKMINTLDSMIGYKSERYRLFGRFAARLDDVANFIPARLTALLIVCVTFSKRAFSYIFTYGRKHASPNSGYPEAAMAGVLDCRFGGPNTYHGQLVDKPYIGENARELEAHELKRVVLINHLVTLACIVLIILVVTAL